MADLVLRDDENGRCTLTLNRPDKLNALDVALFIELREHVDALAHESGSIGCVVLRGAGRSFSAGHDLRSIGAGERAPHRHYEAETIDRLARLPQPVVSAVHGHCFTGGLELALAGDVILAAASARFADTHSKWGLMPRWGMTQRLPRRVGAARAVEMMITGRTYSGQEAAAMGLVNWCVPDEQFDAEIDRLTTEVLENSWFTNAACKRLLEETEGMSLHAGLRFEMAENRGRAPDAKERMARFGKKS